MGIPAGENIGWVTDGRNCTNERCRADVHAGRTFHATPRGFAVTLDTYHYPSEAEAVAALRTAAAEKPSALARSVETTRRIRTRIR